MENINILLVDGDEENLQYSGDILTHAGYHVTPVQTGVAAMTQLNEGQFHLILAEMNLSGMDGIELLRIVLERWGKKLPVIFMAGKIDVETTFMAIKEGARDLLIKPLGKKMLLEAVQYVLERKTVPTKDELEELYRQKLRNSSEKKSLQKKTSDILTLDEISKAMDEATDLSGICWSVMNMIQQTVEATRISILAYHRNGKDIGFQCSYSDDFGVRESLIPVDQSIHSWIMDNKKELMITNVEKEAKFLGFSDEDFTSGSLLAVPFKNKQRILGLIILFSKERAFFKTEFVRLASVLARLTAAAIENIELQSDLKGFYNGTIRALVAAVEAKDSFTFGHSARVGRYALMLAKQLSLPKEDIRQLEYLALLHDIGKIGIPESILKKQQALSAEEKQLINTHPEVGAAIIQSLTFLPGADQVILHHHEWYNGQGYPSGLSGEGIPIFSRIISIADAFDSMTSGLNEESAISPEQALETLQKSAGEQFDPTLVYAFIAAYKSDI